MHSSASAAGTTQREFLIAAGAALVPGATRKIATEVMRIIRTPEMSEHLKAMGMQPIGSTPEEAEKFIRAETAKWGAVIKASGARAE